MYFDSHAHLDDTRFQADFDEVLARMRENGVTGMMNIGCDLPSSERSVALAERYNWIWAAVGSHPDDADHVDGALIEAYRTLCKNPRVSKQRICGGRRVRFRATIKKMRHGAFLKPPPVL